MKKYWDKLRPHRGIFPLSELVDRSTEAFGDVPVMRIRNNKGGYDEFNYPELKQRVKSVARWLIEQGIEPNDRVSILSENRPEWAIAYLGIMEAGAIAVPVDRLMPISGVRHILSDSEAKIIFLSQKYAEMFEEMARISNLKTKVCFDHNNDDDLLELNDVIEAGNASHAMLPKRELSDLAAILYTSGTTGLSKGVMLTHENLCSNVSGAYRVFDIQPSDVFLSVLPMHHALEATTGFLTPIYSGCSITYAHSLKSNELLDDIKKTGVTLMVGVPLLFEKIQQGIVRKAKKQGKLKLLNRMMSVIKISERIGIKKLGRKVFKSILDQSGLGQIKYFVSGGGPLDPEVAIFYNRLGITFLQGYGLTETSPVTHANLPKKIDHMTVGPSFPDVHCRILDPDENGIGEILVKGPNIFKGYYRNEEATEAAFTEDGWFRTGDLGLIREDGFLRITGRAKNMLVTGGGKNVYPEEVEYYINKSTFIAESVVLGVPRAKGLGEEVAALIYPDYEQVDLHFEQKGKKPTNQDVFLLIKGEIKTNQDDLSDYKRVRTFRLVEEEFQKTSTKKIKRFLYSGEMVHVNGGKVG